MSRFFFTSTSTQSGGDGTDAPPTAGSGATLALSLSLRMPYGEVARWCLDAKQTVLGRGQGLVSARSVAAEPGLRISVPDGLMSSSHAVVRAAGDAWFLEDAGSKNGSYVNGQRVQRVQLRDGDVVELGDTFFVFRETRCEGVNIAVGESSAFSSMNPATEQLFEKLRTVADTQAVILLTGEVGTGKEVAARAVHELSKRRGPFKAINCGAIPESLIESELFGTRKGAFSGAGNRVGVVRSAEGGTLLLDEVAELPAMSQVALLRVLQEREVTPLGATEPHPIDVRFIAATHKDLRREVKEGRFREDLFSRLAAVTVAMVPLRERREDLGILMGRLIDRLSGEVGISAEQARLLPLARKAARVLYRHRWPQNIRELEQALRYALAYARKSGEIQLQHLPEAMRVSLDEPSGLPQGKLSEDIGIRDTALLRAILVERLRRFDGNVSAVAVSLGKQRPVVHRWLKRLALDPNPYRGRSASDRVATDTHASTPTPP